MTAPTAPTAPTVCAGPTAAAIAARRTVADLLVAARARLERLTPEQAAAAQAAGGAILVDVRGPDQRARDGELPGAVCHARNVLEWRCDPAAPHADPRLTDLQAYLVTVCHEGFRSSLAAATLQQLGFTRATGLVGGSPSRRSIPPPANPSS